MTVIESGTVLITGPTRGMGRALTLEMAGRPAPHRPDLLLVGRPGQALTEVAATARAAGATAREIPCDLSRLADVRAAAAAALDLLAAGAVRPLRALVANAGVMTANTRVASADGYEMTFAVNYLAHAQLIGDLLGSFTAPARIVFLGSNTYRGNLARRMIGAPGAQWRDPVDLARPATGGKSSGLHAAAVAYATSKLTILYYAHELQRHAGDGIGVSVFEPGFMPGTGLPRRQGPAVRALARALAHLPGMPSPSGSASALASVVLDDRWARLRDGAFVLRDKEIKVEPWAHDRDRERTLWEATTGLLERAALAGT
jgi:NAD(P)-dependent dehydrogenase (short-subunit alcohol dehydrogenase family)